MSDAPERIWINWKPSDSTDPPTAMGAAVDPRHLTSMKYPVEYVRKDLPPTLAAALEKAVELALDECPFRWGTPNYDKWWNHRRTTLAELKGGTNGKD